MRNLKKIIAVVVTLVMLIGVVGISASAADEAPTIVLSGRTQARVGDTYELTVSLNSKDTVGGVEGVIAYTGATYASVAFANTENSAKIRDNGDGTINFVGLSSQTDADGKWFTLTFNLSGKASEASFAITSCEGANVDGTGYVTVATESTALTTYPDGIIDMSGAWILLETGKEDLRFGVNYSETNLKAYKQNAEIEEYGVLLMVTQKLAGRELEHKMIADQEPGLAYARVTDGSAPAESFYTYIKNSASWSANSKGVRISARAYIKLKDGDIIYSNNDVIDPEITDGYSSKSIIGCAKIAAAKIVANTETVYEGTDKATLEDIIEKGKLGPLEESNKTTLMSLVNKYASYVK